MEGKLREEIEGIRPKDVTLLKQGAEARIYLIEDECGNKTVAKVRERKKYRVEELDKRITRHRLLRESKTVKKLKDAGVPVPAIKKNSLETNTIYAEFIPGRTATEHLRLSSCTQEEVKCLAEKIGYFVALMHNADIVHGDLTTSNIILQNNDVSDPFFIDFGLSESSTLLESKAVDLHVCERAINSIHPTIGYMFDIILNSYLLHSKVLPKEVISRLDIVRARGRKM